MRRLFVALALWAALGAVARADNLTGASTPIATTSAPGKVQPDGATITINPAGVISSSGGSATTIVPGTTTIGGATAPCLIENSATTVMACPAVTSGVISAMANTVNATGGLTTFGTDLPLAGGTLTGELITKATTIGTAGLNLPPGTAPTSPANGDVWTTSAGMFAQIAGATVGPFGAGGGGGSGTVTSASVATANGFAGTVATATTTPAITLTTTVTGLLKGNATAISAATAGTDYLTPTGSATGLTGVLPAASGGTGATSLGNTLTNAGSVLNTTSPTRTVTSSPTVLSTDMGGQLVTNVSGGGTLTVPAIGAGVFGAGQTLSVVNYSASTTAVTTTPTINAGGGCVTATGIPTGDTWQMLSNGTTIDCFQTVNSASGGSGTVTTVSVASANGFAGTVANATTTPAITVSTTVTGIAKGNGTNFSAATAGTDYVAPGTATTFTAAQTFAAVQGGVNVQSGTTYTLAATDCGKTLLFTNAGAVTVTLAASIAPASGTACTSAIIQGGATKVSVNGTAVSAASLVSAHSFTGTSGTAGAVIDVVLTTVSSTATAYLTGDGS